MTSGLRNSAFERKFCTRDSSPAFVWLSGDVANAGRLARPAKARTLLNVEQTAILNNPENGDTA